MGEPVKGSSRLKAYEDAMKASGAVSAPGEVGGAVSPGKPATTAGPDKPGAKSFGDMMRGANSSWVPAQKHLDMFPGTKAEDFE